MLVEQTDLDRQRLLLAQIAAEGILGHNSAVSLPARFSAATIRAWFPLYTEEQLMEDLSYLVTENLLRKYNTGHSGYGNTYIQGPDVWYVTSEGLVALWVNA